MNEIDQKGADETLPPNLNLYDLIDIEILSKNDDALYGNVLDILISMFSAETENIKQLTPQNKWKEVGEIVHKLKTSLTHIRVVSLKQIIRDLEDYEQHSNEDLAKWADEFCKAVENILIYLKVDKEKFMKA